MKLILDYYFGYPDKEIEIRWKIPGYACYSEEVVLFKLEE